MNATLRQTVKNAHEFTRWSAMAERGQQVTYHIGNLGQDRAQSDHLHLLAETILIFAESGYVITSQVVMRLPLGAATWYYVSRTGRGRAPRSILFDQCTAFEYRALQAMRDRDPSQSASRAIRDQMGCPETIAAQYLTKLLAREWIEPQEARGYRLTAEGLKMLA
jgi:hypothetical protein